jgi:hypothetical protein
MVGWVGTLLAVGTVGAMLSACDAGDADAGIDTVDGSSPTDRPSPVDRIGDEDACPLGSLRGWRRTRLRSGGSRGLLLRLSRVHPKQPSLLLHRPHRAHLEFRVRGWKPLHERAVRIFRCVRRRHRRRHVCLTLRLALRIARVRRRRPSDLRAAYRHFVLSATLFVHGPHARSLLLVAGAFRLDHHMRRGGGGCIDRCARRVTSSLPRGRSCHVSTVSAGKLVDRSHMGCGPPRPGGVRLLPNRGPGRGYRMNPKHDDGFGGWSTGRARLPRRDTPKKTSPAISSNHERGGTGRLRVFAPRGRAIRPSQCTGTRHPVR